MEYIQVETRDSIRFTDNVKRHEARSSVELNFRCNFAARINDSYLYSSDV